MIHTVPETGSTNADLAERLRSGHAVREGDWLVADRQTSGRGRQGRDWFDGAGNFMGSTAVALQAGDPPASSLALLAGLAVYETVLPLLGDTAPLQLKWPNDLMSGGAKLAGILLERAGDFVVVGIGVNLASAPSISGRESAAVADFGPVPDRDIFAQELARIFDRQLQRWRCYGLDPLLSGWSAAAHKPGTRLSVHGSDGSMISGLFDGLAPDGALMLSLDDGSRRVIHAGDVMLERN